MVSATAATHLEALLSFRHFFRHAYKVEFDPVRLESLVESLARAHGQVVSDLRAFATHLQTIAAGMKG